uniref:C2H2-type domain-containing protein n=1 Tax=Romanomermis culicivorax TaxID=13658 RepID=A0A915KWI1_ROMCU
MNYSKSGVAKRENQGHAGKYNFMLSHKEIRKFFGGSRRQFYVSLPYHCPQCTYSASRRDMITRHMRTHLRQRLGASSSMAGVGGNSSSAPSASFDSSNCECTTRLSDYPTKIDFDFSKEFQHGSVIRRINSAKDLYDSEVSRSP